MIACSLLRNMMRLSLGVGILACGWALACGGRASEDDEQNRPAGSSSGGQPPSVETGGSGAGAANGGSASGGSASGGASIGAAGTGGSTSGGASTGGTATGGAAGGTMAGAAGAGGSNGQPVAPQDVGHVARSCGGNMWSLDGEEFLDCTVGGEDEFHPDCVIVDCAAHGDVNAFCVFSNHCACSEGFQCEGGNSLGGSECESRFSCMPVE